MTKPQGVWLRPTELGEVAVATVTEQGAPRKAPPDSGKPPAPVSASPKRRAVHPLLTVALGACCCLLIGLVSLHIYAGAIPLSTAAVSETAEAALFQPVQSVAVAPLTGLMPHVSAGAPDYIVKSTVSIMPITLPEPMEEEPEPVEEEPEPEQVLEEEQPAEEPPPQPAKKPAPPPATPSRAIEVQPVLASRSGDSEDTDGAGEFTIGEETYKYSRRLSMECTAYTWTGNKTATGTWPAIGTIAVDPRVIKLGSKVYVEGYGFAKAEDTGGLIKGNIIDVYFTSERECIIWGRKRGVTVYILE